MKTRNVKRHYCDHCGKGGFFKAKMEKHERGCTANVNRVCGMCVIAGQKQIPLPELMAKLNGITTENSEHFFRALQLTCNYCPACTFAALRQHPKTSYEKLDPEDLSSGVQVAFSFKEACNGFWKEINDKSNEHLAYDQ